MMTSADWMAAFDDWAASYDSDIEAGDRPDAFPFAGYTQVLDRVAALAQASAGMHILDLGCGTGNLAGRFVKRGCAVTGWDFSGQMLARAWSKWPQATFIQVDLSGVWPAMQERRFERIVSTYALHHFDLPDKARILRSLGERYLTPGGWMVVGDIAFETTAAREAACRQWPEECDDDEYFWAADETASAFSAAGLAVSFEQISMCGGIFTIKPDTLQE
jgi:putative AdoMet-dependent methyltransferase